MLDDKKLQLLRKYEKSVFISFVCIVIIFRVLYCRIQRNLIIYNDDLEYENTTSSNFSDEVTIEITEEPDVRKRYDLLSLRKKIKRINSEMKIHLTDGYAVVVSSQTTVIVIHVHTGTPHFIEMLIAMRNITGIRNALIIFAHDYYDESINDVIGQLNDWKYLQIFYPYSIQLHPDIFPGDDQKFCQEGYHCVRNDNKRDPWLAQEKHFWWWQLHYVFDVIDVLKYDHNGYVLFLQYNEYVAEDLIYMFDFMAKILQNKCPQCEMLSLGAHLPSTAQFHLNSGDLLIGAFGATDNNIGIALNRTIWNEIKSRKQYFCNFNDFRWDESLKFLGTTMPSGKFVMLSSEGPRVLSTDCKVSPQMACDMDQGMEQATSFFKLVYRGLYPRNIHVKDANQSVVQITPAKYWEDIRDRDFCMFLVEPAMTLFETFINV